MGISLLAHFFCWVLVQDAIIELGSLLALVMMGSQITELGPDLTDKRKKKKLCGIMIMKGKLEVEASEV